MRKAEKGPGDCPKIRVYKIKELDVSRQIWYDGEHREV